MINSIIELQKIDCNCNDCKFMVRDFERREESLSQHYKWQMDYFTTIKNNLIQKAKWWNNPDNPKQDIEKGNRLLKEAEKMKFQFDKRAVMNYGNCTKLNKSVSFIPGVCQLETQDCFTHRKD